MWLQIDIRTPESSCDLRGLLFSRPDSCNLGREKREKSQLSGHLGWGVCGGDILTGNAASLPQAFGGVGGGVATQNR